MQNQPDHEALKRRHLSITGDEAYLAYIDVLGFKNLIETVDRSDEAIIELSALLENLKKRFDFDEDEHPELDYFFISDSIVIISPTFEKACWKTSQIVDTLIKHSFLTRGAITYGKIFTSQDGIVGRGIFNRRNLFGVPFQRAYELEQKYAVYPRVIIDSVIEDTIADKPWLIRRDHDGWRYVDHFIRKYKKDPTDSHELEEYLALVKKHIENKLREFLHCPEHAKWFWIKTQFNRHAENADYSSFIIS